VNRLKPYLTKSAKALDFHNFPIKAKLFMVFGFVFAVMIMLSIIIHAYYRNDKESGALSLISLMNLQTLNKIDSYIDDLSNLTKAPILRDENNNYSKIYRALEASNATGKVDFLNQRRFDLEAFNMLMLEPSLHSVFVFNRHGQGGCALRGMDLAPTAFNPVNEKWFSECLSSNGASVIVSSFYLPVAANGDNALVFSAARGLKNVEEGEMIGVILLNSRIDVIDKFVKDMTAYSGQKISVADAEGNVIYDLDREKITGRTDAQTLSLLNGDKGVYRDIDFNGVKCILSYQKSASTGLSIINAVPVRVLNRNLDKMGAVTAAITAALVLASLFFVLILSSAIVKPIKQLASTMRLVERGDFDARVATDRKDEIGELSGSYNRMASEIKRLIHEDYLNKISQKELELQMLKNQINPHFLYNTLESIRMTAESDGNENVSDMLYALGNILRYGISLEKEIVTVREEIEHLKDYILLQQVRFCDIFEIRLDIDESICDLPILKLILQPIVENAIYHGLSEVSLGGLITISGYGQNGNIVFEIRDNGAGIRDKRLKELNDYICGKNDLFKSIGLKNVQRRIELYYGLGYGLSINSAYGEGTVVLVMLRRMH